MTAVNVPVTLALKTGALLAAETAGDAVNGHTMTNSGKTVLIARNNGATPRDLTIVVSSSVDGLAVASRVVSVGNVETKVISDLDPAVYGRVVSFTVAHTDLKLRAVEPG